MAEGVSSLGVYVGLSAVAEPKAGTPERFSRRRGPLLRRRRTFRASCGIGRDGIVLSQCRA